MDKGKGRVKGTHQWRTYVSSKEEKKSHSLMYSYPTAASPRDTKESAAVRKSSAVTEELNAFQLLTVKRKPQ